MKEQQFFHADEGGDRPHHCPAQVSPTPLEQVFPTPQKTESLPDRATLDNESLKHLLREQLHAYNEGQAEDLGGPFTEREDHLLMDVFMERHREWVNQRRIERRRLRSRLGKREFNRQRRRGELYELG